VGRKGAAGEVHLAESECWPIDTTYYVKAPQNWSIRFHYYLLKCLRLDQHDRSTAIPGLNRNDAYGIEIPVPPLPTQHRIVEKIEELFSELDHGVESLKKAQKQLRTYRQAVLKDAFEGKLTKEWREQQSDLPTPEELLEQIKAEREAHRERELTEWKKEVEQWEKDGENVRGHEHSPPGVNSIPHFYSELSDSI
jgi:type I restriction enzyme, S subunit